MNSVNAGIALPPRLLAELQRHAAGRVLYVPMAKRKRQNVTRNREIRRARAAGASIPDLAKANNLSESRVWELCHGLHPDSRTPHRTPTLPLPRKESHR